MNNQIITISREQFNKDLETCLTIKSYPSKRKPFYVCDYISPALITKEVKIEIRK